MSKIFRQDMIYNIDDSFLPTILSAEVKKRKFQVKVVLDKSTFIQNRTFEQDEAIIKAKPFVYYTYFSQIYQEVFVLGKTYRMHFRSWLETVGINCFGAK